MRPHSKAWQACQESTLFRIREILLASSESDPVTLVHLWSVAEDQSSTMHVGRPWRLTICWLDGNPEPHTREQGVRWMMERELTGDPLGRGDLHLHPCWLQLQTEDGSLMYTHRVPPYFTSTSFFTAPTGPKTLLSPLDSLLIQPLLSFGTAMLHQITIPVCAWCLCLMHSNVNVTVSDNHYSTAHVQSGST